MSGVFVSAYILTFTCFGPGCLGTSEQRQMVETPSQLACVFLRDALMRDPTADRIIDAECHGEARAYSPPVR